MKKNNILTLCLALVLGTGLTSCEDIFGDFLDKEPSSELTGNETFSDWTTLTAFHLDTYNFLKNGRSRVNSSWLDTATDLAENSYSTGGTRMSFNIGNYYSSSAAAELTDPWENYYRGIRKCNMTLTRIDDVPKAADLSQTQYELDKTHYKGEARFLRAYFYWELFLRYGPVPVVTEVLDPDGDLLSGYTERPSVKEYVVDFILKELKECELQCMDKSESDESGKQGRINKPAVRALYSRVMLYMASPRYSAESGITWTQAAEAAKSFIDDYGQGYGLYYGDNLTPEARYANAILLNAHSEKNNETIFYRSDVSQGWSAISNDTPVGEGGSGGLCPSQNLVDMYDMADGTSPFQNYDDTGAPLYTSSTQTPAINAASGYDDAHPTLNRDPRLSATILYNGASWGGKAINVVKGQKDNPTGNANATPTGYYVRKYIPEVILNNEHTGTSYCNWIFIRYAEILLNYAEALNEVQGPGPEVFGALQQIRDRAGLTAPLADRADLKTKDNLRNFIRKERTVELCFEEHRPWDVRRWNVAGKALSRDIIGVNVSTDGTYTRKVAQSRVFEDKMYLYPIPETEYWKTGITNNPGW